MENVMIENNLFLRYLITTKSKLGTEKFPNYILFWNFNLLQKQKIIP